MKHRRYGWGAPISLIVFLASPVAGAESPTPLAIAEFDYADTSGEPADQTSVHEVRIKALSQGIQNDLEKTGKYRIVSLVCDKAPCRSDQSEPKALADAARRAGAKLLLFGWVHKTSTLILSAKVEVLDIQTNKLIFDRFLSFRGDNDESWRRMERFVAGELDDPSLSQ